MTIRTKVAGAGATKHPIQLHEFLANVNISQSGIAEGFEVSERSSQALGVKVALGRAFLLKDDNSLAYPVWSDADVEDSSVDVTANGSGNPRIDTVVLYYDEGELSYGDDGSGVVKLLVVVGTPSATPSAPSDGDIITAMGGDYPYISLADIDVASGVSVITDSDITDRREDFVFDVKKPSTEKETLVNADVFSIFDSALSFVSKYIDWESLKSNIKSYIDSIDIFDSDGNKIIEKTEAVDAVNHVEVKNSATGDAVELNAKGDDPDIQLNLNAKGDALTGIKVLRQDDTSNSYDGNSVILTGWGYKVGDNSLFVSEAVSFGIAFSDLPIVLTSAIGIFDGSDPVDIGDFDNASPSADAAMVSNTEDITVNGFTVRVARINSDSGGTTGIVTTRRAGYSWIAIGVLN